MDVTKWDVDGMSYARWRADHAAADDPSVRWRDEVVIPFLQQKFDALTVHEDGRLYGVRGNVEGEVDERFYDPELLRECLGAKCPGQGWQFALGCCFKQHRR